MTFYIDSIDHLDDFQLRAFNALKDELKESDFSDGGFYFCYLPDVRVKQLVPLFVDVMDHLDWFKLISFIKDYGDVDVTREMFQDYPILFKVFANQIETFIDDMIGDSFSDVWVFS